MYEYIIFYYAKCRKVSDIWRPHYLLLTNFLQIYVSHLENICEQIIQKQIATCADIGLVKWQDEQGFERDVQCANQTHRRLHIGKQVKRVAPSGGFFKGKLAHNFNDDRFLWN